MKCPNCDEPEMYEDVQPYSGWTRYVCDNCHYEETR